MQCTGNVIPATWYKTITTASGKADLAAINILSDVLYWYRPSEIRDEATGDIIAYRKRFSADLLQRSYDQLAEHFGLSKRQAKDAVVRLEELGAVRRVFRNVDCGAGMMGNVMFIAIDPAQVLELTYPDQSDDLDPMAKKRQTYTKITQRLPRDYLLTIQPTSQKDFLATRGTEGWRKQARASRGPGRRFPAPRLPNARRRRPGGYGRARSQTMASTGTSWQAATGATSSSRSKPARKPGS